MARAGVLLCLAMVLGGPSLLGQGARCVRTVSVPGVVRTAEGRPLPDASVSVPAVQRRLVTDAAGHFALRNLCPGSYRVRVTHLGYATVDREYELSPGTRLEVSLLDQAVEIQGLRVEVAGIMMRLERRRATYAGRSSAFDWRDFTTEAVPANIPEWVARQAGARVVACGDAYWGTRDCFLDRRGLRRMDVCVDETESVAGPTVLSRYPREEIGRAEFYRREGLMKIYTKEFLARAALAPWMIRASATAC